MRVVIPIESRFKLCNGRPASHHLSYERFWKRYLSVFDSVVVVGRLFSEEDPAASPVEGDGVTFAALPPYSGALGYLRKAAEIRSIVRKLCEPEQAYILRVPGIVGSALESELRSRRKPFAVEVVANPYDVFAPEAFRHPLWRLFRWFGSTNLRRQCRNAIASAYVTESALQQHFPCHPDTFTTHYSSVELPSTAYVTQPRCPRATPTPLRLISVGTMEQMYKGFDVLIEALRLCVENCLDLQLVLVGDGKHRVELEDQVRKSGLESRVTFLGKIAAGEPVQQQFDAADLFVLPSRQEGLPRAMIEAMARGLPCLGTPMGGIPELLAPEDLIPPNDAPALADRLREVATNSARQRAMSERNLAMARDYHRDILMARRVEFYQHVKRATEAACVSQAGSPQRRVA